MGTEYKSIYEMHRELAGMMGRGVLELEIKGGRHDSFIGLCDYYEAHYKPLLEQLAKEKPNTAARFIVEDMDAIFLGYMKEYEND